MTRAKALQDEDTLEEEQNLKGKAGEPVQEERPEEETQASPSETEWDAEDEAAMVPSEVTEDSGQQGEDSLRDKEVDMFGAAPGFENSLENTMVWGKGEEGERLRDAGTTVSLQCIFPFNNYRKPLPYRTYFVFHRQKRA